MELACFLHTGIKIVLHQGFSQEQLQNNPQEQPFTYCPWCSDQAFFQGLLDRGHGPRWVQGERFSEPRVVLLQFWPDMPAPTPVSECWVGFSTLVRPSYDHLPGISHTSGGSEPTQPPEANVPLYPKGEKVGDF